MQESKWPPSQDPVPGYIALPHSSYGYRESPGTVPGEITAADIRSESGYVRLGRAIPLFSLRNKFLPRMGTIY